MSLDPYNLPDGREFRLRMEGCNSTFPSATYGRPPVVFKDGVTVVPVDKKTARRLAAAWGHAVLLVELWEDEPTPQPATPYTEPSKEPDLSTMDATQLRELAESLGIEIDGRWSTRRIRRVIEDAQRKADG